MDNEDRNTVALSMSDTGVRSGVANANVNVRYNVVDTDISSGGILLGARFVDNGTASQVIVDLHALNVFNGQDVRVARINSNGFGPSAQAQFGGVEVGGFAGSDGRCDRILDFNGDNVYYIDVSLVKTALNGTPLIRAIEICPIGCVGPPE